MIKFISYDGKWPALCMGTLVVEKNGKQYSMKYVLESGGSCGFNKDYSESYIEYGEWSIDEYIYYPKNLKRMLKN